VLVGAVVVAVEFGLLVLRVELDLDPLPNLGWLEGDCVEGLLQRRAEVGAAVVRLDVGDELKASVPCPANSPISGSVVFPTRRRSTIVATPSSQPIPSIAGSQSGV
jgi:hypothetical protein